MVQGWATDKPTARHPWLVAQAVRVAAAHRQGCITEADHQLAVNQLVARFRTRLNVGSKRPEAPGETAGALAWGRVKVSTFTEDRLADELGRHGHPGEAPPVDYDPVDLTAVDAVFSRWLGADYDLEVLHAVLAVAAAGLHLSGDPAWLLIVAGSGMTKTETVAPLSYAGAVLTSTIGSESALLSGTSRKERVSDDTGGLLHRIGDRGVLVLKDVTSVLAMNRDARSQVLAALREVFDGRWDRPVGSDGGQTLTWIGRCVLIGAVTTAWDEAHAVIAAMGDRFLLVRPPEADARAAGVAALRVQGREEEMRAELGAAVAGLLQQVDPASGETDTRTGSSSTWPTWSRGAVPRWRQTSAATSSARTPGRRRPASASCRRSTAGGRLIGLDDDAARALVVRVARDSMPPRRRMMLAALLEQAGPETTYALAGRAGLPRAAADRHLQALQALRLATHRDVGAESTAWRWALTDGVDRDALGVLCDPSGYVGGGRLSGESAHSALAFDPPLPTTLITSYLYDDTTGRSLDAEATSTLDRCARHDQPLAPRVGCVGCAVEAAGR